MKGGADVTDEYITLEQAAELEGITYKGLTSRLNRNPDKYDMITRQREGRRRKEPGPALRCLLKPEGQAGVSGGAEDGRGGT